LTNTGCGDVFLRYSLPRSKNIGLLLQREIDKIINRVNNRTMKCLWFKTPSALWSHEKKGFSNLKIECR
jgi:IS30 family transposase